MSKKKLTNTELLAEVERLKELAEDAGVDTTPPAPPTNNMMDKLEVVEQIARDAILTIIDECEKKTGRSLNECARPRILGTGRPLAHKDPNRLKMAIGRTVTRMSTDLKRSGMDLDSIIEHFFKNVVKGYYGRRMYGKMSTMDRGTMVHSLIEKFKD